MTSPYYSDDAVTTLANAVTMLRARGWGDGL